MLVRCLVGGRPLQPHAHNICRFQHFRKESNHKICCWPHIKREVQKTAQPMTALSTAAAAGTAPATTTVLVDLPSDREDTGNAAAGSAAHGTRKEARPLREGQMTVAGVELEGCSVAGLETCIILPRWKVAFDLGRCPHRACLQGTAFISHGHLDHIGGLPAYVSTRQMLGMAAPRVYLPSALVEPAAGLLAAAAACNDHEAPCHLLGLDVGGEAWLKDAVVRPFATQHRVPSQGYVLSTVRRKLKPHLVGRPGSEIAALRRSGEEVTDATEAPEVAFTGDTTLQWIREPSAAAALRAKLLILEVTFVDDGVSVEGARERGHTHLDELAANADAFAANEALLLIHFSTRTDREGILAALDAKLPPELRTKCTPLLAGQDRYR